eukprot:2906190-Lingulodinium_polyedra.AAC.1
MAWSAPLAQATGDCMAGPARLAQPLPAALRRGPRRPGHPLQLRQGVAGGHRLQRLWVPRVRAAVHRGLVGP